MKVFTHTLLFILAFCCISSFLFAQGQVSCKIIDNSQKPVPYAAVALLNEKDSSLVKSTLTDTAGNAVISVVNAGEYYLAVNMVGYTNYTSSPFEMNALQSTVDVGTVELQPSSVSLNEVEITYKKPFIETKVDRTVVNVEGSAVSAGSSVLEVLMKSPGVLVSNEDNISMNGKQGVIVMIDDKPTLVKGKDLADMLRGMPSETVEKIELITNPSAKYDAQGNAGIINIKTKKDKRLGTNGSVNASYGQGKYAKANTGINVNNRTKNFNLFGSYNYGYRYAFADLSLERKFYTDNVFAGAYIQNNYFTSPYHTHSGKAGVDWYVSPKTVVGVVLTDIFVDHNTYSNSTSEVYNDQNIYTGYFTTDNFSTNKLNNYAIIGNFKTTFDSTGRSLSGDLDYARYDHTTTQDIITTYYTAAGNVYQPEYLLYGTLNGKLDIKSAKVDYTQPLADGTLEAGLKASEVNADNDLAFYDRSNPEQVYDTTKSNHFLYTEDIAAAYISYRKETKAWNYQLGLRGEMTHNEGKQVVLNKTFTNDYFLLFPTLFIQKTISPDHQLGLSISRRIDRPDYRQLNPFKYFLDPSTYMEGNPYLKPQISWNYELSETFKNNIIVKLGYSRTTDNITEVLGPSPTERKITIQTAVNLSTTEYYSLNIALPVQITKWWNMQNNIGSYYGYYTGNIANTSLSKGNVVLDVNMNNNFTLGENTSAELNANYHTQEVYAYMTIQPIQFISIGFQQNVMRKQLNIKFNVSDIFYSQRDAGNSHFNTYDENFIVRRDTRVATLALTWHFGSNTVTEHRKTGGAEEEKNRARQGER